MRWLINITLLLSFCAATATARAEQSDPAAETQSESAGETQTQPASEEQLQPTDQIQSEPAAEAPLEPADETINTVISEVSNYWSVPVLEKLDVRQPSSAPADRPGDVITAQMLTPQRSPSLRTARRSRRRSRAGASSDSLASVPYMIGDTGAGTCLSFGGLLDVELSHPTLACSRLNISENNSPVPTDRLYMSYRHFENATPTRVFQFERNFNVDRFTLGGERTFFDGMFSLEIRAPLEGRLNSNVFTQLRNDVTPAIVDPLAGGTFAQIEGLRRAELGNISLLFKALLMERSHCGSNSYISAGVGLTLPTAKDVNYGVDIIDSFVFPGFPGFTADQDILLDLAVSNETVYISPFLAWLWQPKRNFFHQGFLQVEVAANPNNVRVIGSGLTDLFFNGNPFPAAPPDNQFDWFVPFPGRTELFSQTILRLNLGWGYVLAEDPRANWVQRLTSLFEVHYTSTVQDANISSVPVIDVAGIGVQSIEIGNRNNRVDIVNCVLGLSADVKGLVVTNGFTVPVTTDTNRGFDFEYNLQIQKPF